MARSFFSGFITTIAFILIAALLLGVVFLLASYLAPIGIAAAGY